MFRVDYNNEISFTTLVSTRLIPFTIKSQIMKKILFAWLLFTVVALTGTSQTKDITGTITNEKNENIVGAAIKIKGTTLSAFSDDNGVFNLTSVPDTAVLVISAAGYQDMEVKVTDRTTFAIVLVKSSGSIYAILTDPLRPEYNYSERYYPKPILSQ